MSYTPRQFATSADSISTFDSQAGAAGVYSASASLGCNDVLTGVLTAIAGAGAFVQGAAKAQPGGSYSSVAQAFGSNNSGGNCIVVDVEFGASFPLATCVVTDSQGNTYVPVAFFHALGSGHFGGTFVAFGINAGANTVTATFSGDGVPGSSACIAIHEYAGGSSVDTSAVGYLVADGTLNLSVTTANSGDLLHLYIGIGAACAGSPYDVIGGNPITPPFLTPSWLLVNEPPTGSPATGGGITDRSTFLFLGQGAQHSFNLNLRQRGVASYTLVSSPNDPTSAPLDYLPTLFQPIYLYDQNNQATDWPGCTDGWALVFAGIIQDFTVRWVGTSGLRFIDVSAVSLEAVFDTIYCDGTDQFVNQTCGAILTALFNKYEAGCPVSLGTIQAGATVPLFTPNKGQKLSEMFEQLATTSEFIWGVNPSTQTLYFEAPTTTAAPFTLTSNQSLWDSISNKIDGADYRNRQGIKLSDTAFPQSGETFIGSGQQSFTLMRAVKQVVSAYATLGTPNFATLNFSTQPAPGDTFSIGPNDQGWSVHNSGGTNPWVVGTIIVVGGYIFKCTTGGVSAATQPTAFLTETTLGDTVTDGVAIWTCQGSYTTGNGAQITWTWVSTLDNTQAFQVLIGATLAASVQNAVDAINNAAPYGGPPATNGRGLTISLPEWENGQVNAAYVSGTQLKVTNIQDAAPGISALSASSSAFSWSSPQTEGGSFPQGSLGPNEPGTISLQVYEQGTSTAAPGLAYTPGSVVVTLATPLNTGSQLNVYYIRADAGSIEVEDTALVAEVAAASHGTGKIQQFSDQSELGIISTSATAGLQLAQQVLEAFDVIPMFLDVILYQPGILPGQLWTWDLDDPWSVLNGQYFVQEVKAEIVNPGERGWLDNPNALGAGHYRYTIRVVDAAQAQSYLDTWEGFAGGSSSGGGGAGSSTVPTSGGANSTQGNYGPSGGLGSGVNVQNSSYAVVAADQGKLVEIQDASPHTSVTVTLEATAPTVTADSPWAIGVQNASSYAITLSPNGLDLDGSAASLSIAAGGGVVVFTDGANYFTVRGIGGSGGGGVTSVALTVPARQTVTGSPVTSSGTLAITDNTQTANEVFAGPSSGSAAAPTFRAMVPADLPAATSSALGVVKPDGTIITVSAGAITVPKASSSAFGVVEVDGTTITASGGVISAVGGGGGGGALTRIAQQVLASAAATVTFSSIPGTYSNLLVTISGASSDSASNDGVYMQVNGDSGAHYYTSYFYASNSTGNASNGAQAQSAVGTLPGATALPSHTCGQCRVEIINYAGATFLKTATGDCAWIQAASASGGPFREIFSWFWDPTTQAAITELVFGLASGSNFIVGSTFTLYGIE